MQGYSGPAAARITGVHYECLRSWGRSRFLQPSLRQPCGRGSKAIYSNRDLLLISICCTLRKQGISLQALRKIMARLGRIKSSGHRPGAVLLVTRSRVRLLQSCDRLVESLRSERDLLAVIELAPLWTDLQKRSSSFYQSKELRDHARPQ